MTPDRVVNSWLFRGLCDLYFAFECDDDVFEDYERFSEIMGMEKFLKALLLYHRRTEYEALPNAEARKKIDELAKKIGHKFESMLSDAAQRGATDISLILARDFDGYIGKDLVGAVYAGYMETRYPTPVPVSAKFPVPGHPDLYHDPLSSSGITKFVYAVCNACFFALTEQGLQPKDMLRQFEERFSDREAFSRFTNYFWEQRCRQ
jgi:hypothetical protein